MIFAVATLESSTYRLPQPPHPGGNTRPKSVFVERLSVFGVVVNRSHKAFALLGVGALLLTGAGCSTQSSSDSGSAKANAASSTDYSLNGTAQPESKGQALLDAINSATKSVDIVIYQIGSPDINSALVNAMKRNVKVRVVIDSGSAGNVTKGKAFVTAMNAAIAAASANPALFTANWSSDNFNFTHQKSVMIDAVDSNGATLASGSMPSTAKLLISTGNFLPNVNPPEPFYGARDFYVTTPNQDLINRASLIFTSDFSCAGRTATNNPLPGQSVGPQNDPKLVWSNGSTGMYTTDPAGSYPSVADGYFSKTLQPGNPTDQGNSFNGQLNLIKSAKQGDVVRVYNEEMASPEIIEALTAAATPVGKTTPSGTPGQGADVRIVMSFSTSTSKSGKVYPSSTVESLEDIATAGGRVTLFANQNDPRYSSVLYIHAKVITVTPANGTATGFMGSENFSDPSMKYNRELGVMLDSTTDSQVLNTLQNAFDKDFSSTTLTTQLTPANPKNIPPAWLATSAANTELGATTGSTPALRGPATGCGPISVSGAKK